MKFNHITVRIISAVIAVILIVSVAFLAIMPFVN